METQCFKNIVDMFPHKLVDQIQDKLIRIQIELMLK